ncbi:MAG: hypothetical protein ACLSEY_11250 [Enterocloster sp.]
MLSDAALSPSSRHIPDIEQRIKRLEDYEQKYTPIKIDFEEIIGKDMWEQHWANCQALHDLMQEAKNIQINSRQLLKYTFTNVKNSSPKHKK